MPSILRSIAVSTELFRQHREALTSAQLHWCSWQDMANEGESSGVELRAVSGEGRDTQSAPTARPLVLPEVYDGTGTWDEWAFHFENVSAVNHWDDVNKLKWL